MANATPKLSRKWWLGIIVIASLNASLMFYVALFLLRQPYVHGDEELIIQLSSVLKNIVLGLEDKPKRKDLLFINVSYDRQLIDYLDADGFLVGNRVITDREKLSLFLEILAQKEAKFKHLLLDVRLEDSSEQDAPLQKAIRKLGKKLTLSAHLDDSSKIEKLALKGHNGIADYRTANDVFIKFNLLPNDTLKSVPLKAYEAIYQVKLQEKNGFYWLNGKRILIAFVPEIRVRNFDLLKAKRYNMLNLGELLMLPDEQVHEIIKDRLLVLGDFVETDNHQTIYGETAGPLILLNTLIALEKGDNVFSNAFILFLLASYFLLSLLAFYPGDFWKNVLLHYFPNPRLEYIVGVLGYLTLLIITSLIAYFAFGTHLSILYLSIYLYVLDRLFDWFYIRFKVLPPRAKRVSK